MKSSNIKRCSDCGRFLSEDDFKWQKDKRAPNGGYYKTECNKCSRNRYILWREDNSNYWKQYNKDNKEHIKEYSKQHYQDNKKYYQEYSKQFRKNNKEYRRKICKQWREDNTDKINTYTAKRRAEKLNQTPVLTESEKQKILFYYNISECMGKDWHVDHIKPISKGGLHHPDNLQVIPAHHNMCKGNNENYIIPDELIIKI